MIIDYSNFMGLSCHNIYILPMNHYNVLVEMTLRERIILGLLPYSWEEFFSDLLIYNDY